MDLFQREDLRALASRAEAPCVTLMMPTARVESEFAQNPIRLKNLLKQAVEELSDQGYRDEEIDVLLEPARALFGREDFWKRLDNGLIMFLEPGSSRIYRLPLEMEELVVAGSRYHLKPLFPLLASNNRFYLLALNQNKIQLFQGTHYGMNELHTSEIPRSLTEALALDDPERTLQLHTGVKMNRGRQDAIFHGHGHPGEDYRARPQDALRRFFQRIDSGLKSVLGDDTAPMLLSGVSYYLPIYRQINSYPGLIEHDILAGNWEHLTVSELHKRAWERITRTFDEAQDAAIDKFNHLFNNGGNLASADLGEIVPASVYHRVDTLFVPIGSHQWGTYDPESNAVELHDAHEPGDEDLFDLAAVHTYLNGGTVHALRDEHMPMGGALCATFRYAPGAPAEKRNGSAKSVAEASRS